MCSDLDAVSNSHRILMHFTCTAHCNPPRFCCTSLALCTATFLQPQASTLMCQVAQAYQRHRLRTVP
jgi:hypothetical protein